MRLAFFLLLAVAQMLWVGSVENDSHHGELVPELNVDVDYRDFNQTVDFITEANAKATHQRSNEHQAKKGSGNYNIAMRTEHDVFPIQDNITFQLHEDCNSFDCSGQYYRRMLKFIELHSRVFLVLSLTAFCLIILTTWKMSLTRGWGYSPAMMEDRGYELRLIRIRARPARPNPPNIV